MSRATEVARRDVVISRTISPDDVSTTIRLPDFFTTAARNASPMPEITR